MQPESLFADRYCDQRFFRFVYPYLFRYDAFGLRQALNDQFPADVLVRYLEHPDRATVKVALICLALVGRSAHCNAIVPHLADEDPFVVRLAEYALISIWHNAGSVEHNRLLRRAIRLLADRDYDCALLLLNRVLVEDPQFAEAYHHRAAVYYLQKRWAQALADAQRALELNPVHFPAGEIVAHCRAVLGELAEAVRQYYAVLRIHPQLEGVQEALRVINDYRIAHPTRAGNERKCRGNGKAGTDIG